MDEQTETPKKEGINPLMIGGIIVLVLLLGLGFMSRNKGNNTESQTSEMPQQEQLSDGTSTAETTLSELSDPSVSTLTEGEVKIINIEGGSFYFKPNEIHVKKGEKVKIEMESVDMMHDFVIDELGVRMPVTKAGETGTVEFTVDQVGEFEFYCSVGQHRANGQVGKLIVEE